MIYKPRWLWDEDLFIDNSVKEGTLHIHLEQYEPAHASKN